MRPDEIVKEDKYDNHTVSALKRIKAITSFAAVFELLIKGFHNIVGYIIPKACNTNMLDTKDSLSWHFVSGISVINNAVRLSIVLNTMKQAKGL